MDVLLAVCLIVATLSIGIIAAMVMRAVRHFESATDEFKRTAEAARASIAEADRLTRQLSEEVVPPLRRSALQVEQLTERATELSNAVLDEVRRPLETTMSVIRGVQAGARSLAGALRHRRLQPYTDGRDGHA